VVVPSNFCPFLRMQEITQQKVPVNRLLVLLRGKFLSSERAIAMTHCGAAHPVGSLWISEEIPFASARKSARAALLCTLETTASGREVPTAAGTRDAAVGEFNW
jgi:hypothetical protein